MMKKNILIIIVCVLLVLPIVYSEPPFAQVGGSTTAGLDIKIPLNTVVKPNIQLFPHFHVFNTSNGYAYRDGDIMNCTLHIYGDDGKHIHSGWNATFKDIFDIGFVLPETLLNTTGRNSFIIQCENDVLDGGFVSGVVSVTESGEEKENILIPIIMVQLLISLFYFWFGTLNKQNVATDSTKVSTWLTILCYAMLIIKSIALSFFVYTYYIGGDIGSMLHTLFFFDLFVLGGISVFTLVFAVIGYANPDIEKAKWNPTKW